MPEVMYVPRPLIPCTSPAPCPDPCDTEAVRLKKQTQCICGPLDDDDGGGGVDPDPDPDECLANLSNDLVAYWDLNTKPDTDTIGGRVLTVGAGITSTSGKLGNGYTYSGSSTSFWTCPDDAPLRLVGTDFTIRFWLYIPAAPTYGSVLLMKMARTDVSGWRIELFGGTTQIQFGFANGTSVTGVFSSSTLPVNEWVHCVFSYRFAQTEMTIYMNADGTIPVSDPDLVVASNTAVLRSGDDADFDELEFIGLMDEVLISNYAWTQCDVTSDYNLGAGRTYPFA